ncbi:MAG: hypothetical protein IMY77_02810 [Chloroflexi bacterium]|nr:hypothetical protein [Chloroflexota bacterium]
MNNILYPDSGNPLEDRSILRNAVYFSTAQRAYSAQLILQQPLNMNNQTLAFSVIRAFEEFMTSTEDLIGWLFVLEQWQPGKVEFSLINLLDKIEVGRTKNKKDYTEARAVSLLSSIDAEGFRELIHVPEYDELVASGKSIELVNNIKRSMPRKLEGWLKVAKMRAEEDRGMVRMFNKCKHHMLAFRTTQRGKEEIWLPTSFRIEEVPKRILLGNGWLENSVNELRHLAGVATSAQAILHDTLALILSSRYSEEYSVPQWILRAYDTDYMWLQ